VGAGLCRGTVVGSGCLVTQQDTALGAELHAVLYFTRAVSRGEGGGGGSFHWPRTNLNVTATYICRFTYV
jgi:hypothetical protein